MFKAFASGAIFVTLLWVSPSSSHESVNVQISALGAKIQKDPKNPSLYLERADLQRREKHYAEALRDLDRAQKLAPERKDIVLERGLTLAAKGDTEEAEKLLSKYLAMGTPSAKAFVARGKIRESALRYADARSDYAAAVALESVCYIRATPRDKAVAPAMPRRWRTRRRSTRWRWPLSGVRCASCPTMC